MKLSELIKICKEKLNTAGIEAPTLEAGVIICHCLNVPRAYLYAHPDRELTAAECSTVFDILDKRVNRMPLQQLLGSQEFMSMEFVVNGNVLIPRQDTEVLVETVIELRAGVGGSKSILEIGTGSGCIAVSLAKNMADAVVTAVDISVEALAVAKKNAQINEVMDKVTFIQSDLFSVIDSDRKFDIIVSNPPYIPTAEIETLEPEVRCFEPINALDGGADGLDFYRKISAEAKEHINDKGLIAYEVGINQAPSVAEILNKEGYSSIRVFKDLAGIERVVCGELLLPKPHNT